jgi:predicted dehydrogenase
VKVSVIGTGELATKARIPAYLSNKNADLVALVDTDKERVEKAGKRFGVKNCFTSVDELFEKQDVDAVSICTPPHTHADLALKALRHGAHVLCEKPMANDVEKGKEMFDVSQAKERVLLISSYRRFVSAFWRARDRILKGALGHVYCIEDIQLSTSPLLTWAKSPWYYHPEGGGVLYDLGPHCFDLINYLYGDFPIAVSATGSTYLDSPVEECCICTLEYPENRMGVGTMSWLAAANLENTDIYGTVATRRVTPKFSLEINRTEIYEVSLWREVTLNLIRLKFPKIPLLKSPSNVDPIQLETNYFLERVKQKDVDSDDAMNALNVLFTIDAAKRSMKSNQRIQVASIRQ